MKKHIIAARYEIFFNEISLQNTSINFLKICALVTNDKQEFYKNTIIYCCMFRDTGLSADFVTKNVNQI